MKRLVAAALLALAASAAHASPIDGLWLVAEKDAHVRIGEFHGAHCGRMAQEVVAMGDLGYWPPGHAFCIFFGPTPASRGDEIRPASAVNVLGRIEGDATQFKKVRAGTRVTIERA